jgi:hypothetical protein
MFHYICNTTYLFLILFTVSLLIIVVDIICLVLLHVGTFSLLCLSNVSFQVKLDL